MAASTLAEPAAARAVTAKAAERSLLEIAKHVVLPEGITSTAWPSVRATCAKLGLGFDRWQADLAKAILAKNADGLYAADTVAMSIPRQVGKTYLIGAIIFALCIIHPGLLVLWTAHRFKTARETFRSMAGMAELPLVKRHVVKVTRGSGDEAIEFRNGSRILFGARERGFGRGIPGVGVVVFDEAQILTEDAVDDMVPATNVVDNPLVIYTGTPPKPKDPGEMFSAIRREARNGESTGTLYVEISADEDADPDDREQVLKANPSVPHRTSWRSIQRMRTNLSKDSFRREALGIWDGDGAVIMPQWSKRAVTGLPMPKQRILGVASNRDGTRASIGMAAQVAGHLHVGAVDRQVGTDWLFTELPRIQARYGVEVWVRAKGALKDMLDDLTEAGVDLVEIDEDGWVDACGALARRIEEGKAVHANHATLNRAMTNAGWRKIGDRRAFVERAGDISMLEAVTVAAAGALGDYNVLDSIL